MSDIITKRQETSACLSPRSHWRDEARGQFGHLNRISWHAQRAEIAEVRRRDLFAQASGGKLRASRTWLGSARRPRQVELRSLSGLTVKIKKSQEIKRLYAKGKRA